MTEHYLSLADLSKADTAKIKNLKNSKNSKIFELAERLDKCRITGWEPETPESVLPSYLTVKRAIKFDRKDSLE